MKNIIKRIGKFVVGVAILGTAIALATIVSASSYTNSYSTVTGYRSPNIYFDAEEGTCIFFRDYYVSCPVANAEYKVSLYKVQGLFNSLMPVTQTCTVPKKDYVSNHAWWNASVGTFYYYIDPYANYDQYGNRRAISATKVVIGNYTRI